MKKQARFIIAAPTSNAGKTSISLGLMRAFLNREKRVQAFKCGPDYIDPKFHELATGKPSFNLDLIMMPETHVQELMTTHSKDVDVAIVEGVMGMFDGAERSQGSSAEISKKLDIPVVLVVNAKSVAYSVAPLLHGFKTFDPEVKIAGVIFNKVNTESHFRFLKEACEDVQIECFGYMKNLSQVEIPSRHLGLSISELDQYDSVINELAGGIEDTVDLDALINATTIQVRLTENEKRTENKSPLKIAVAKDEAFNFIYAQNLLQFKKQGTVTFFSPLKDKKVPNCDLLYFPGGYPECYLKELSSNKSIKESILKYVEEGGKILAECGGFMYLGTSVEDEEGTAHKMVGALRAVTSMKQRKMHLGYRKVSVGNEELRGHEFHYSSLISSNTPTIGKTKNIRDEPVSMQLFKEKGILASYHHFYLGTDEQFERIYKWITQ
ncbi:MAG: cobyrinate a,c-diamide synthase [Crocinitomicaceae bacterium]|nr:cobyrinate a,c-diamide synthase [Crocinitomicaceae bacterium]